MRYNGKIFGIGLNKTGTTSLSQAVEILGYPALHFGRQDQSEAMTRAVAAGRPFFTHCPELRTYAAYFDIRAVERHFDVLDEEFPESRFILHTRELQPWLDSREKHIRRNQQRAAAGLYSGKWLIVDRKKWTQQWHDHFDRVRLHFEDRPDDLLEIDVPGGDGWEKLAPFLGCPIPGVEFPWANHHFKAAR